MKKLFAILVAVSTIIFISCSDFQKALKSKDYTWKYEMAKKYYEKEDWFRAEALLSDLLPIFRGTEMAKGMMYMYAYCQYNLGELLVAVHYFKTFSRTWPNDSLAEEADFMVAKCLFEESPRYNLDQSNTIKAIEALDYFVNRYPTSDKLEEALGMKKNLQRRLEKKSFYDSRLYYQLGNYKAAVISFKNTLKDYPESDLREEVLYLILRSSYLLAKNSIDEIKMERFQDTINEYYAFIDEYPNSKYAKEAEKIYTNCIKAIKREQ
ncbi:MAG TPA: outer membrane protein assembly factor BamD [Salinivirgaceae bacterium]|nr:outer membrane protein assembly factor BamD [Salinivirgaceae bacterium]